MEEEEKNLPRAAIGAAYDFHVGHFGIAPSVNPDSVDGQNVLVYGVVVIYPF